MTDALDKLIEAVEGGEGHEVSIFAKRLSSIARDNGKSWPSHDVEKAWRGSLDAAKALHEALLPGWILHRLGQRHGGVWEADLMQLDEDGWHNSVKCGRVSSHSSVSARSWTLAILKAYRSVKND